MAVPQSVSLYVGDLDPTVGETELFECFSAAGPVSSVRLCRDSVTRVSLRYAYVNFFSLSVASKALESLNHANLKGKPMRIMWSQRDPLLRKTGVANLFIKNLDPSVDSAKLHDIFGKHGSVLSCKVVEENGKSKGFGFVQFDSEEAARDAVKALHGSTINNKKVYVSKFVKKSERQSAREEPSFTNVYVNNLDHELTDDLLKEKFSAFGTVKNAITMKDDHGESRGFGFVCFESSEDAKKAVETMNGAQIGSKKVYVGRAQTKDERELMLRRQFEERHSLCMDSNVYVKNLDDSVDDNKLQKHFSICGKMISAKVMRDNKGFSRGFGFVCFFTHDDAKKAVDTLHGTMFHDRPLYVAIAKRKEDRQNELQLWFAKNLVQFPTYNTSYSADSSYHSPHCNYPSMSAITQSNPYQYQQFEDQNVLTPSPGQQGYDYETIHPQKVSSKQRQQRQMSNGANGLPLQYPQHTPGFPYIQHNLLHPVHGNMGQQFMGYDSGNHYPEKVFENQKPRCIKNVNKPSSSHRGSEALRMELTGIAPEYQKQVIRNCSMSKPGR